MQDPKTDASGRHAMPYHSVAIPRGPALSDTQSWHTHEPVGLYFPPEVESHLPAEKVPNIPTGVATASEVIAAAKDAIKILPGASVDFTEEALCEFHLDLVRNIASGKSKWSEQRVVRYMETMQSELSCREAVYYNENIPGSFLAIGRNVFHARKMVSNAMQGVAYFEQFVYPE
jgi:hypothetical protein